MFLPTFRPVALHNRSSPPCGVRLDFYKTFRFVAGRLFLLFSITWYSGIPEVSLNWRLTHSHDVSETLLVWPDPTDRQTKFGRTKIPQKNQQWEVMNRLYWIREGFRKKTWEKAVRLTAWVDPSPSRQAVRYYVQFSWQVAILGVILPFYKRQKWVKIFTNRFGQSGQPDCLFPVFLEPFLHLISKILVWWPNPSISFSTFVQN